MRAVHSTLQTEALRLIGQLLDVTRQRVVGLVAMHVDAQAAFGRDLAKFGDRPGAVRHRALEMGNPADDVDAHVERADRVLACGRVPIETVLREGDELQIEIRRDSFLHVQQRLDGEQTVVAGIDMGADGQKAHRNGPVAIGERPLLHRFMRQERLQLAPKADALEKRSRRIDARRAVGQRRVHVEMRIDEGRCDKVTGRIDQFARIAAELRRDGGDTIASNADIGRAAVGQRSTFDDQIEIHRRLSRSQSPVRLCRRA